MTGPATDPDLAEADRLLAERIGLDPEAMGRGPIARAVAERRLACGAAPGAYAGLLSASEEERQALVEAVVVPESWFFRDRLPFEHLARVIAPNWRDDPSRPPLRVLCLPCAGGEEPYSAAMTLLDAGLDPSRFLVEAVDVSRRELDRARRGEYRSHSFRGVDATVRDRHFEPIGRGWRIRPPARDCVSWSRGNLLDPGLADRLGPRDVVFCRNLLIYLHDDAKRRAVASLGRVVRPGGTLFVGHAEASLPFGPAFRPSGPPGSFALDRVGDEPPLTPEAGPVRRRDAAHRAGRSGGMPTSSNADRPTSSPPPTAAFAPIAESVDTADRVGELANRGAWDAAVAMASRMVSRSPSAPSGYVLLGAVEQAAGRPDRAEAAFRRAVYLDGDCVEALLAMAALVESRGDRDAAANYRRRAERSARRGAES